MEIWQNATEINIFIYHSTRNDESNLMMCAVLQLVQKPKCYAKNKISHFLRFPVFFTFWFFEFFGTNLFRIPKLKLP